MLAYVYAYSGRIGREFVNATQRLKGDRKGVTALEYGLMAALVSLAIVGAATTLGGNIATLFTNVAGKVSNIVVP